MFPNIQRPKKGRKVILNMTEVSCLRSGHCKSLVPIRKSRSAVRGGIHVYYTRINTVLSCM